MKLCNLRIAVAVAVAFCLTGCTTAPRITASDLADTLKDVVEMTATSRQLPPDACISTRLDKSHFALPGNDDGSWQKSPGSSLTYRILKGPKAEQLPRSAADAIPVRMRRSDCRHRIVIDQPLFVQTNDGRHKEISAFVNLGDRCPICGAGYEVMLTKIDGGWKSAQADLERTWSS